jgi:hypothetical protein
MKIIAIILVCFLLVGVCAAAPMTISGTSHNTAFITTIGSGHDGFVTITKFFGNVTLTSNVPYSVKWFRK